MGIFSVHCCDCFAREIEIHVLRVDAFKNTLASLPQLLARRQLDIVEQGIASDVLWTSTAVPCARASLPGLV